MNFLACLMLEVYGTKIVSMLYHAYIIGWDDCMNLFPNAVVWKNVILNYV